MVKEKRRYNTILGLMLCGLIWFNIDESPPLHSFCAVAFFVGNTFVMVGYSPQDERWFKWIMVAGIAIAIAVIRRARSRA